MAESPVPPPPPPPPPPKPKPAPQPAASTPPTPPASSPRSDDLLEFPATNPAAPEFTGTADPTVPMRRPVLPPAPPIPPTNRPGDPNNQTLAMPPLHFSEPKPGTSPMTPLAFPPVVPEPESETVVLKGPPVFPPLPTQLAASVRVPATAPAVPVPAAPAPAAPASVAPAPAAPTPAAPAPVAPSAKAPVGTAPAAPTPAGTAPAAPSAKPPAAAPAAAAPAKPDAKAHAAEPQRFPEVEVELFPGDESLTPRSLRALSMFRREPRDDTFEQWLKKVEDWLEDRPGALVLRRYSADDLICEEGEAGWTAFYILTADELLELRKIQLSEAAAALPMASPIRRATLEASLAGWKREQGQLEERHQRTKAAMAKVAAVMPEHAKKRPAELWALADEEELRGSSEKAAVLRGAAAPAIAATVSLSSRDEPVATTGFLTRLFGKKKKPSYKDTRSIPIDGPADLDRESRKGIMFEGELFGEMTCRFRTPRSASVTTTRDVYMLELLPHVFEKFLDDLPVRKGQKVRDPSPVKAFLDQVYKERTLTQQLSNHPVFGGLPQDVSAEFARELKPGTDFPEFDAGQVIFKQGDVADALYVVRVGVVRVEQAGVVLGYKGRGELIGEMGVLENKPRNATCVAYAHPTQTKGKTRVSLVRITKEVFDRVLRKHVQPKVEALVAERRAERDAARLRSIDIRGPLEDLGIPQGERLMLIDLDRCTRCDECVKACASTHEDGRSRLFREGPVFERFLVPASCRQCRDPVCTIGCPVGAIHKGDRGNIVIESWCVGCELCSNSCPYGSIQMHDRRPEEQPPPGTRVLKPLIANVCDQCQTLGGGTPSCVYACPHGAALRVDALEFMDVRQRALAAKAPPKTRGPTSPAPAGAAAATPKTGTKA